ncbi:hypothetical protein BD779DRAFT_95247 [Infundibulicybe gibba]|nr:hypothetical protein BD779DRAFT_95247 [Infundibulicybe gibba]
MMTITEPKQEKAGKSGEYAEPKRGTKRKTIATLQTESEHDESTSGHRPAVRVQKKRIVSDDEDVPQTFQQKTRLAEAQHEIDSEAERDLQAMMEVDDDQVIHASRNARDEYGGDPSDAEPDTEIDEAMETEMIKPKTRKRKEKKQVPVGKNGLKQRRVVKSRTMMRNGYMETEDYSSYESVDEESAPPSPATKTRVKSSKKKEKEPQVGTDEPTAAQASKPVRDIPAKPATKTTKKRTNGGQKKLANFFGPAKAKS